MNYSYRKKPVAIEAFQMTKERRWDNSEWPNWLHKAWNTEAGEGSLFIDADDPAGERLCVGTLEGVYRVKWGDWIIQGVVGEIYPCADAVFVETYDVVAE